MEGKNTLAPSDASPLEMRASFTAGKNVSSSAAENPKPSSVPVAATRLQPFENRLVTA
jgi:hypothetical protein